MPDRRKVQRYGWVRDIPDRRDAARRYAAPAPADLSALPAEVDHEPLLPAPYDQAVLGSCVGNAVAGLIQGLYIREGTPDFTPSRLFIYYNARLAEGTAGSDSGCQIRDAIASVASAGAPPEDAWPYDPSAFARRPTAAAYAAATPHRLADYQRLEGIDLAQLLVCLASGWDFVFGFSVYESFESPQVAASGQLEMPSPGESLLGGHAVLCCGYDLKARRFKVRNSWGARWGMKGYFSIPMDYVTDPNLADDFWTADLAR